MTDQAVFAQALLQPELPCPSGLVTWNRSDPAARFAVYRNNVMVSLVDALADTFPVVQQLVGEPFFRAMARVYAQAHPPRSAVMAYYGDGFAAFVEGFAPAATVPYLADVARLEMARVLAYHSADLPPLDPAKVQAALANPEQLLTPRPALHPSVSVIRSAYAVYAIWDIHQHSEDPHVDDVDVPQNVLIMRTDLQVRILPLGDGDARFIQALCEGHTLLEAADSASQTADTFDLPHALALLLQRQLITALSHPEQQP